MQNAVSENNPSATMQNAEQHLADIAKQLRDGKAVTPLAVRDFLTWFGSQRRGTWIVEKIRQALRNEKIQTEPDFNSVHIDSHITFSLEPKNTTAQTPISQGAAAEGIGADSTPAPTTATTSAEPNYLIGKMALTNYVTAVPPDATLQEVVTLMLTNDFSQLPVWNSDREVKGVVSWTSIGTRLAFGKNGRHAREFMDTHQELSAKSTLFQAIPIIARHQYVLVRGDENRISRIVTASDLSEQFQQLSEPFLLLEEIENSVRHMIRDKFTDAEIESNRDPGDPKRRTEGVHGLTVGEHIRLLQNKDRWKKLNLSIDRAIFCKQLDDIRHIRNEVMHFNPDPLESDKLKSLRDFAHFLQRVSAIKAS